MENSLIRAPIRAVKFLNNSQSFGKFITGEGNQISIHRNANNQPFKISLPVPEKITGFLHCPVDVLVVRTEFSIFSISKDEEEREGFLVQRLSLPQRDRILALYCTNSFLWVATARGSLHRYSRQSSAFECKYPTSFTIHQSTGIFYSASIMQSSSDFLEVVFGTIFSGIQVYELIDSTLVLKSTLRGHVGTVFDLIHHPDRKDVLISCSDDRSTRVWNTRTSNCQAVFLGHEARIWQADVQGSLIASVSEDNSCKLWDLESGSCIETINGSSFSKGVLSVSVCSQTTDVLFGSSSGEIYYFKQSFKPAKLVDDFHVPQDYGDIKNFALDCEGNAFLTTSFGDVLHLSKSGLNALAKFDCFSRYSVVAMNPHYLVVAGIGRNVHVRNLSRNIGTTIEIDIKFGFKVKISKVLMVDHDPNLAFLEINEKSVLLLNFSQWPHVKQMETPGISDKITSVLVLESSQLFIGTRKGHLHIFKLNLDENDGISLLKRIKIADDESLTCINFVEAEPDHVSITDYSGGITKLHLKSFEFRRISVAIKGTLEFISGTGHLIGFHQSNFCVYDPINCDLTTKIPCGGAHRLWKLVTHPIEDKKFIFGYLSDARLTIIQGRMDGLNGLARETGHGREIRCAHEFHNDFVVSGSEDGLIILRSESKVLASLRLQNSSVKALCSYKNFIFAAGSNESLVAIEFTLGSLNFIASCGKFCSVPETRILSLDCRAIEDENVVFLVVGYSDASLRVISYDISRKAFKLCSSEEQVHNRRCVQQLKFTQSDGVEFISTGADGMLSLWRLHRETEKLELLDTLAVHASGINALDIKESIILTGGEDGTVAISEIDSNQQLNLISGETLHHSAVTAVRFMDGKTNVFVSASVDQRVCLVKSRDFQLKSTKIASISDIAALSLQNGKLCVFGMGFEFLDFGQFK